MSESLDDMSVYPSVPVNHTVSVGHSVPTDILSTSVDEAMSRQLLHLIQNVVRASVVISEILIFRILISTGVRTFSGFSDGALLR